MEVFLIGIILISSIFVLIRFLYIKYKGKKAKAKVLGYYYDDRYRRYIILEFKDDKEKTHRIEKYTGGIHRFSGVEPVKLYEENSFVDIIYIEWKNMRNEKERIILDNGKEVILTEKVFCSMFNTKWRDSSNDLKANKIVTAMIIITVILLVIWLYID